MKSLLFCFMYSIVGIASISALKVSPFVSDFDPTNDQKDKDQLYVEKKKEFTYTITNKMSKTFAFEITVLRRYIDKNGHEKLVKDDKSFDVYPAQLIIPPHTSRDVKLKWKGNSDFQSKPHDEQAFRVSINQFYVDLNPFSKKKRGASMRVAFNVQTSLYMTPSGSRSEPVFQNIDILPNGIARVTVCNKGNRRIPYRWIRNNIKLGNYEGSFHKLLSESDQQGSLQPGEIHEFIISNYNNEGVIQKHVDKNATNAKKQAHSPS